MNPRTFKAAILDLDGVITQTAKVHARAWKQLFDAYLKQREERDGEAHQPFDIDADYRQYVDGKPRYDGVQSFLESRGIALPLGNPGDEPGKETICGLGNRKNEIFHATLDREGVEVYTDTVEQIGAWKRAGWKVAVISSSRNCEAVLKAANLLDLFDAKVDGNDLGPLHLKGKPAPDMFLHAAQQLGVEPSQAIVVEDAISGVQAAREGQFGLVVGIARDRDARDLREAGADIVIKDLRELQDTEQFQAGEDRGPTPPVSALENTDEIASRLQHHTLALFLDYDGTLTPIVRRPEDATLSEEMRALLRQLAQHCTVAIVSGRDRQDAEGMVQVENLVYAGSHGFDIRGPEGLAMQHEGAKKLLPELDAAERQLRERITDINGAHVERKRFAIAVHYREVADDNDVEHVEKVVDEVCQEIAGLRKKGGKKIFEVQPDVEWDKGRAVLWLVQSLGLDKPGMVIMYIGDDVTDEDAFRALRRHDAGIGIRVATPDASTDAAYYLRDCEEVQQFLQSLLAILQESNVEA
jgi:trehalose 6-phosphate phosphatase